MSDRNQKEEAEFEEYSLEKILFYEKICGRCFLSFAGKELTKQIVSMVGLKPGEKVLDIGGGIGGSAFYMAKGDHNYFYYVGFPQVLMDITDQTEYLSMLMVANFNVMVTSVDKSANITRIGQERAKEVGCGSDQVVFETADIAIKEYPPESFDVVVAIASLFYIEDKASLLKSLYTFLKPGGRLLISDLCCQHGDLSQNMQKNFVHNKVLGYPFVVSLETYGQMLRDHTRFTNIQAEDRSLQIRDAFRSEITRVEARKIEFIEEFGEAKFNKVIAKFIKHLELYEKGDLIRGSLYAEKLL